MRRASLTRIWLSTLCVASLSVSTLSLSGCAALMPRRHAEPPTQVMVQGVQDVSLAEARDLSLQGVPLIDVREPHEYAQGHAPGARNLPLSQLDTWSQELDPQGGYVLICRTGKRSATATQRFEAKGFKNLRNATSGMLDWEAQGYPMERP